MNTAITMNITLFHNPNCSKSRQTLKLLQDNGISPNIVTYLSDPPEAETILRLARLLNLKVEDLVRKGEEEVKNASDLPAMDDDAALANWVHQHPGVLQRPIAVDEDSDNAVIGRPPENVLSLLRK